MDENTETAIGLPRTEWDEKNKERNARRRTLRFFYSRPSIDRSLLARFLPISSGFLIRAIFPGRSHVNFRRPMTRQAREAQTSMIFRVSSVGREQNSRSTGSNPLPLRLPAAPLPFSRRYENIIPYQRYVTICNICKETKRDGINKGGMRLMKGTWNNCARALWSQSHIMVFYNVQSVLEKQILVLTQITRSRTY